jgi:hypothetical protein
VRRWLERHPRFHLHFTPTSASWMNMVERFFRDLSQQAILPGSFGSVAELVDTINLYLAQHNCEAKALVGIDYFHGPRFNDRDEFLRPRLSLA